MDNNDSSQKSSFPLPSAFPFLSASPISLLNSLKTYFSIPNLHIFCLSISLIDVVSQIPPPQKNTPNQTSLIMEEHSWERGENKN